MLHVTEASFQHVLLRHNSWTSNLSSRVMLDKMVASIQEVNITADIQTHDVAFPVMYPKLLINPQKRCYAIRRWRRASSEVRSLSLQLRAAPLYMELTLQERSVPHALTERITPLLLHPHAIQAE